MSDHASPPNDSKLQGKHRSDQPAQSPSNHSISKLIRRWSAWSAIALERPRWPYAITVIFVALLALGEQFLEYSIEQSATVGQPAMSPLRLLVFPLLVVYILSHIHILKRAAIRALAELRSIVLVNDETYTAHVKRMIAARPWIELALLVVSVLVVLILFVGLKADLLNTNSGLPPSLPATIYIVIMYVILGWILLSLVYNSIRHALALNALAQCPLTINVFDSTSLLPFGRMGLIQSLPIVGIVLVPLILFGTPTMGGYLVIVLSAVSFLVLFVPLWGVHQQIDRAHEHALEMIHNQLQEIHNLLLSDISADLPNLSGLTNRTTALIHLRKTIMESPSWPFKDSAATVRAILAVSSPMIYFILNELIRLFLLPILAGNRGP